MDNERDCTWLDISFRIESVWSKRCPQSGTINRQHVVEMQPVLRREWDQCILDTVLDFEVQRFANSRAEVRGHGLEGCEVFFGVLNLSTDHLLESTSGQGLHLRVRVEVK